MTTERDRLRKELESCTLNKSWYWTTACVLVSTPVCIRLKSYVPLGAAAIAGTAADLLASHSACSRERAAFAACTAGAATLQQPPPDRAG